MYNNKLFRKVLSLVMCLVLVVSYLPAGALKVSGANQPVTVVSGSKKADPSTIDWENYFGPDKMDTEFAGGVWTDKSVFTGPTSELPGVTMVNSDNFLIALSAIASNLAITGHTSAPTDTMLVLDMSGSMVDGTYEVGTIRQGNNNYETVNGIDMSLINAMIEATNATIDKLMKQNTNNRVGVVLYSGNAQSNQDATPSTATVVLPLDRYTGIDGEYLSVDASTQTEALYRYVSSGWFGGSWQATGQSATYVPEDTAVNVSVKDSLKTEAGGNVTDTSKRANGGTYIQNGLYQAMNQFLSVNDTVVPEGRPQAGAERMPVLVLMTDGAPTIATTSYTSIGNSNTGDGTTTNDRITFLTQLTAAYVRGRVASHYQENDNDQKDVLFLTLGLGTENSSAATNTLYPAGSNSNLVTYWNRYLRATAGQNVTAITGNNSLTVRREADVEAMNYVDKYYYASDAQSLIDSFSQILGEIELKSESYATLVEGGNANYSGYVTFEDELGEMMHVADMKGVLMSDGNGGTVLYTGRGIAEGITEGNLGSVDDPTARGDELVRTVKERIPGTTTSQAQQLIGNAYADQQLYYAGPNNWSNYIGWYADADGNYVGFWDKDSGYENAPADAVYANRSYGYLGVNGDSDMMHVVVMVRTELATLHQTVNFKIPASLLPTVQYKVTLDENDPSVVEDFQREDAIPMQLVFEVGLRSDINSVNLEKKIAEHLEKGGHVHRNGDGTVTFYTTEWAVNGTNDTNGNGIPDPEEVENAMVAESHFHPAMDNSRYYYTEDTLVLDASGNPVKGATRPTGEYFHHRYIYNQTQRVTMTLPIAEDTLKNKAQYDRENDQWYIPAGTIFGEVSRFKVDKTENTTNTLTYSDFPAVFENGTKQDVYAFLGNNGSFILAPAQGIALTKTVAETSDDPNAPDEFTFTVTLSQAVANPVITDTDGNALTDIASVDGNVITVTLTAGQTVVISGIPTGTSYTVEEVTSRYYTASSANASGAVAVNTVHAVDFVNTAKAYGSLVVSKDVNYPLGFVPGTDHNDNDFTIHVTFTGDITGIVAPQGATRDDNTFTLTLKDGQSATFTQIPEGVTYTVTEDSLPAGYALQAVRYSDAAQTISSRDLDEAHVVNSYTLQPVSPNVKIQGDKILVTNEGSWQGETFTVELLRIDNFADEDPEPTGLKATLSQEASHYEFDLSSSIEFTKVGTYYFRVVEVIPEARNEDIAYDRTFGLFSITVADDVADGNLEIKAVRAYQNTGLEEVEGGWILEKDFTNVVTTDRIYLDIQKHVVDASTAEPLDVHLGDITFGLFTAMDNPTLTPSYYALTNTQGKATIMIPVTKEDLGTTGMTYYLREIAPSTANRVVGMNYDESWLYAITITWDEQTNKAVASYAPIENGQIGSYEVDADGMFSFEHTNTYESDVSVNIDLTGSKTINGSNDLGGRTFSFSLYESSAAFVKGKLIKTVSNNGNAISFNDITFNEPGVYYMVAKEDASTLGGITVDGTEYHITVEVEKFLDTDGTTRLRVVEGYPTVVIYGTSQDVGMDGLNFNNRYTVTGSGDVTIGGKKTLSGRFLAAGEFTIGLYSDAQCTDEIETTTNRADGTFSFGTITYTPADLGENYAEKTYTYYVKEINDGKGGVSYDPNVYTVTVEVSHEDGVLVVTPSGNATTLQISNIYQAKPVDVELNGSKVLSGDWTSVLNKDFTFRLFQANEHFEITNETPLQTKQITGNGSFAMELTYEDGDEGFYYYVLKEYIPEQRAGGVSYDAGEYHITINVTDPGDGQLVALTNIYRPGTGNTSTVQFTNSYSVEPTSITLEGTKSYINSVTGNSMAMEEGMFSFVVMEGENLAATGYNLADGTIRFTPIRYTAAGVHTYSVVEIPGDAGGVGYDDAVFTVTVTVVDNGDGTLTATEDYNNIPVAFENTYTHKSAQVTINGVKKLTGDWSAVSSASKIFNFELFETGSDFVIGGTAMDRTVNESDGSFTFGAITYTTEGTRYYVIMEGSGASDNGITYDDTQIQITVVVTDDGNGNLIPTVTTSDAGATVAVNNNLATVDGLSFTNTYEAASVDYPLEIQKIYEGDAMKTFDFVLSGEGFATQTKQNDDQGKVVFDNLTFESAGTYTFTVKEKENVLWGFIKWDTNKYELVFEVTDNGLGQLEVSNVTITSTKGRNDLVFRNVHEDLITKKDVALESKPDISIDGQKVQAGDVLVYTITYTNYTGTVVDEVTITDTIPQNTELVTGSAGTGVLSGNQLSWKFTNVAVDAVINVSFKVKATEGGVTVTNKATVLEGTNTYETNEVTNPVEKKDPALAIVKEQAVGNGKATTEKLDAEIGNTVTYFLTVTNSGEGEAQGITVSDKIPEGLVYVTGSADNGGTLENGVITWKIPSLAAGQSVQLQFKVKIPTVTQDTSWTNVATMVYENETIETNEVVVTAKIPVTPDTGDNFSATLFITLMILSSFGIAAIMVCKKREEENTAQ